MGDFHDFVKNLEKHFKEKSVLNNINFHVNQGDVVGLLGENGAGKTTLLRLISTLLVPSEGSIKVQDFDTVKQQREVRRKIGILFGGETGLYQRLTARENIYYFGQLHNMPSEEMENQLLQLARYFSFESFLDQRVGKFSGGCDKK